MQEIGPGLQAAQLGRWWEPRGLGGGGSLGVAEKEQQDHVHPPEKLLHLDLKGST